MSAVSTPQRSSWRPRARAFRTATSAAEISSLPYWTHTFDVVTGFNAFQFAADPVAALSEARRVARPGGDVLAAVWGQGSRVDLMVVMHALSALVISPPRPASPSLSEHGVLESGVTEAGLVVRETGSARLAFEWPDEETMLRGMMSAGGVARIAREAGEEAVAVTLRRAMEEFRTEHGGYRLENDWRYVLAGA